MNTAFSSRLLHPIQFPTFMPKQLFLSLDLNRPVLQRSVDLQCLEHFDMFHKVTIQVMSRNELAIAPQGDVEVTILILPVKGVEPKRYVWTSMYKSAIVRNGSCTNQDFRGLMLVLDIS